MTGWLRAVLSAPYKGRRFLSLNWRARLAWKVSGSIVSQKHQAVHNERNVSSLSFPSACCLPAWMLYMMKIRTNKLEDIIIQSSSQVLCHNWKLELMGLPEPVMCRSEHRCYEHALCFPAVPLVCHLHLKLVPLIKSHMSPQNNNFKNPPSSSVPLNQSQTWQTARMELGCLQAIKAGWETESGKQGSRAV